MKITRRKFVATVPLIAAAVNGSVSASPFSLFAEEQNPWQLWYQQPAGRM